MGKMPADHPVAPPPPGRFDEVLIRHQVKYLGLMENLRVRRAGFAYRRKYEAFLPRWGRGLALRQGWGAAGGQWEPGRSPEGGQQFSVPFRDRTLSCRGIHSRGPSVLLA